MADVIRRSAVLQDFFDVNGITKRDVLKVAGQNPDIISANYNDGILIIVTSVDPIPIIIEVELKN